MQAAHIRFPPQMNLLLLVLHTHAAAATDVDMGRSDLVAAYANTSRASCVSAPATGCHSSASSGSLAPMAQGTTSAWAMSVDPAARCSCKPGLAPMRRACGEELRLECDALRGSEAMGHHLGNCGHCRSLRDSCTKQARSWLVCNHCMYRALCSWRPCTTSCVRSAEGCWPTGCMDNVLVAGS